jgi:hypothetical protein
LIDAVATVLFRAMSLIVCVAPLGVLGTVAYTVGKYGIGSLRQLISPVALFYVSVSWTRADEPSSQRSVCHQGRFVYDCEGKRTTWLGFGLMRALEASPRSST